MGLPLNLRQYWVVRYIDRREVTPYMLVDVNTFYRFHRYRFTFQITNLLNASYQEIPGVPMPGREFRAGIALTIR